MGGGVPSTADAVRLMRSAWALRARTLAAPPASEAELQTVIGQVRGQLAEAVAICRQTGAGPELITALGRLGHVEQNAGRPEAARACSEEAVAVARSVGDPLRLAHALRHLGDVDRRDGRLAEAEARYEEALALYERSGSDTPPLDHANALRPMAILQEERGRAAEARDLWLRARDLYRAAGIEAGVDEATEHLTRLTAGD